MGFDKSDVKRIFYILSVISILFFVVIACCGSYKSHDYTMHLKPTSECGEIPERIVEVEYVEVEPEIEEIAKIDAEATVEYKESFLNLTFEEMELIEQVAMAEARGEGTLGMAYVMRVIINRSEHDNKSITEVIFRPGAFDTSKMDYEVSDECHEALAMVMDGWDESQGALFFNGGGYRDNCEPLFQYGGHYFSK